MAKRIAVSNRTRFEVFKRDSFKCQYCGKSAPDVILNADHIIPVSQGGSSDILNLVTSCFECNSGKSDIKLSDNSAVSKQKKQLDELSERREQLNMLIEWRTILDNKDFEIDKIVGYFNQKNSCNISLTDTGNKGLKLLLKKHTVTEIIDSIDLSYEKYSDKMNAANLWDSIPRMIKFNAASDDDKQKMKFWGAIKGRFDGTAGYARYNIIHINSLIKNIYEHIDNKTVNFDYSFLFSILNSHTSYRQFSEDIQSLYSEVNQ